jgi:midasin
MGSDLPCAGDDEAAEGGAKFTWCDGVFLTALKNGDWVLLDELNLASQSVLEGLNSCLDHRAQVFIPELSQTFDCPPSFRIFAAQNPLSQGGGRKGLPKSFLNRFTKVFVEALTPADLRNIVVNKFPSIDPPVVEKMVQFNSQVQDDIVEKRLYGQLGFPWEFNLRDVFRWCQLVVSEKEEDSVGKFVDAIYLQRMRSLDDRKGLLKTYADVFQTSPEVNSFPVFNMSSSSPLVQVGGAFVTRQTAAIDEINSNFPADLDLPRGLRRPLETVARCVQQNWPCLIIGPASSGKNTLVRSLAVLANVQVEEAAMTPATDVTELLGCFEQSDSEADIKGLLGGVSGLVRRALFELAGDSAKCKKVAQLSGIWGSVEKRQAAITEKGKQLQHDATFLALIKQLLDSVQDLIGGADVDKARVLLAQVTEIAAGKKTKKGGATFRWVDGVLVKAMQDGRWLHLQNVNFCPASVLDRLNPLMEIGGELVRGHPTARAKRAQKRAGGSGAPATSLFCASVAGGSGGRAPQSGCEKCPSLLLCEQAKRVREMPEQPTLALASLAPEQPPSLALARRPSNLILLCSLRSPP